MVLALDRVASVGHSPDYWGLEDSVTLIQTFRDYWIMWLFSKSIRKEKYLVFNHASIKKNHDSGEVLMTLICLIV